MPKAGQLTTNDKGPDQASGLDDSQTEPESSEERFIAVVLLTAGLCLLAFVALHGQVENDADTQIFVDNFVTHVDGQGSWGAAQTLRIVAYLSWMVGLVTLMRQGTSDYSRRIASYTSPVLLLGTGLWLMHITAEYGTAWLTTGHADAPELGYLNMAKGLRLVDVGILTVAGVTHSLGLVGVGLNLLSSQYPKWFGWSLIAVSAPPAIISISLGITSRFSLIIPLVYFSVALALWSIVIGITTLRRTHSRN